MITVTKLSRKTLTPALIKDLSLDVPSVAVPTVETILVDLKNSKPLILDLYLLIPSLYIKY